MKNTLRSRRPFLFLLPAAMLLLLAAACALYVSDYSRASAYVQDCLQDTDTVQVQEIPQGLFLDGPGTENALIFYPGGKVEYTAYLPLLHLLAEEGTDCFLVRMPANLAFLGMDRADGIIASYKYKGWYLAGHSLGGVAAASYAADHDLDGLILLAAYSTKPVDEPTLQIYGSRDGVLHLDALDKATPNLPEDTSVHIIEGGNHAGFGDYGEQKGDGEAQISRAQQQRITADLIMDLIGRNK